MAKIKISQNPTFKTKVAIPRVGADPVSVEFEFKYMDRLALAAYFDKWNAARDDHAKKVQEDDLNWKEATGAEIALQAGQLKEIIESWGFDEKLSDESLAALVTTCIGAPQAVLTAYQSAYQPARLGN